MEIICTVIICSGLLALLISLPCLIFNAFYLSSDTTMGAVIKTILLTLFVYAFLFSLVYLKFISGKI